MIGPSNAPPMAWVAFATRSGATPARCRMPRHNSASWEYARDRSRGRALSPSPCVQHQPPVTHMFLVHGIGLAMWCLTKRICASAAQSRPCDAPMSGPDAAILAAPSGPPPPRGCAGRPHRGSQADKDDARSRHDLPENERQHRDNEGNEYVQPYWEHRAAPRFHHRLYAQRHDWSMSSASVSAGPFRRGIQKRAAPFGEPRRRPTPDRVAAHRRAL